MSKRKLTRNDNLDGVIVPKACLTYKPLFKLLVKYNISHNEFCDASGISRSTLQRMRECKDLSMKTIRKMIITLNKLNTKKCHQTKDIYTYIYKMK